MTWSSVAFFCVKYFLVHHFNSSVDIFSKFFELFSKQLYSGLQYAFSFVPVSFGLILI